MIKNPLVRFCVATKYAFTADTGDPMLVIFVIVVPIATIMTIVFACTSI